MSRTIFLGKLVSIGIAMGCFAFAQQKPLTNDDVITMVKSGMPESVVVSAIQSRPGTFSTSTSELVRLHKAGVTENELNAMIAASSKGTSSSAAPFAAAPNTSPSVPKNRMPTLTVTAGGNTQELHLEKTQLGRNQNQAIVNEKSRCRLSGHSSHADWNQPGGHDCCDAHELQHRRPIGAGGGKYFFQCNVSPATEDDICLGSSRTSVNECSTTRIAKFYG